MALLSRGLHTPLVSLNGTAVLYLPPGDDDGRILTGDLDGDKHADLLVQKRALVDTWLGFGKQGVRMATFQLQHPSRGTQAGDTDGDGIDELLNLEAGGLASYVKRGKIKRRVIETWPAGYEPAYVYDIDRDGIDEIFACQAQVADRSLYDAEGNIKPEVLAQQLSGKTQLTQPKGMIFHPDSGQVVELQFPQTDYTHAAFTGNPGELAVGDPDGDGKLQLFAMPSLGSMLLAFNADGKLAYYEEFGQATLSLGMLHAGKKDFLVVQLEKKLVSFP